MKKRYAKPQIVFENFALSTNIAGDCEVKNNLQGRDACPYTVSTIFHGDRNIFITEPSGCTTIEADGDYNGLCYHVPLESNNLFTS